MRNRTSVHAAQSVWAVQVKVNGILYGVWGRENYGTKPIKVDALEVCESSSVNFPCQRTVVAESHM